MERIRTGEDFDRLLESRLAVVFKHSTMCPVSSTAHREVDAFLAKHSDLMVRKVHVIEDRTLSDYIEVQTGVRHESPQLLLLRDGEVVWQASHFGVSAAALEERIVRGG